MSRYPHQLAYCHKWQYVYWWGAANLKKRKRKRREKKEKEREKGKEKRRKEYRTVLCQKIIMHLYFVQYRLLPERMWSHRPWGRMCTRMHVTHESGRSSAILTPSQLIFFCIVSLEADHRAGENFAASEENMVARNPVNLPFFSSWSGCAVEALVL